MKLDDDSIGDFIDKKCPKCGSNLLGNKNGDVWCSYIHCDYLLAVSLKQQKEKTKEV